MLKTVRMTEFDPLEESNTLRELRDAMIPEGLVEFVRVTVPAKPFRLAKLISLESVDPTFTWIDAADVMLKSTTFTVIVILCVDEPLVAVMVTR